MTGSPIGARGRAPSWRSWPRRYIFASGAPSMSQHVEVILTLALLAVPTAAPISVDIHAVW